MPVARNSKMVQETGAFIASLRSVPRQIGVAGGLGGLSFEPDACVWAVWVGPCLRIIPKIFILAKFSMK